MDAQPTANRSWTFTGLALALLGIPAVVIAFRSFGGDPLPTSSIVARELVILAGVAFLLWIVLSRERLSLASIGIGRHGLAHSLGWGLAGMLMLAAGLAACLVVFQLLGIKYGEGGGGAISTSLWVTLLTVIRAGVAEEVFYRGYAIERLQSLTGSRWLAILLPLVCFAGFHYRQGWPGIVLALVLGAILTGLYLWKRNLVANIVAHFLIDFLPNVLLPLLTSE